MVVSPKILQTVMWHVDDLKVSHTSQDVVDKFIHDME